jgi:GNAT superfamily N-acetyltransferase
MVDPAELEPIAARAWRAAEEADLGGWRLFASSGFSGRINACWPLAPPDRRLPEAIAAVEAWYAARRLPPVFKVVEAAVPDLTGALAEAGYRSDTETLMMIGPVGGAPDPEVAVCEAVDAGFAEVFAAAGSSDPADARERLEALGRIAPPRGFARLDVGGAPAAIGACAVERDWTGVFGMRTAREHRRQGLARRVFRALMAASAAAGARHGYLQVEADNAAAIALYADEGFAEAYRYRYWRKA